MLASPSCVNFNRVRDIVFVAQTTQTLLISKVVYLLGIFEIKMHCVSIRDMYIFNSSLLDIFVPFTQPHFNSSRFLMVQVVPISSRGHMDPPLWCDKCGKG